MHPALLLSSLVAPLPLAQEPGWRTQQLSEDFTCEGASFGDLNGDGVNDVVAGPFWWEGPDFSVKHRYYDGQVFDSDGYSDHFFSWVRDLDGDGDQDVFMVGFPGKSAQWFENPGGGAGEAWARHLVHDNVDNESPHYTDLTGNGREELVCHSGGILCWFEPAEDPRAPWVRHDLSEPLGLGRFTHGMGVGDVTGDGRADVLLSTGFWVQPESLEGDPKWERRPFLFSRGQGGAQMLVSDVDGDGDGDVITSLNAHRYGLAWFENVIDGGEELFVQHDIMGAATGEHGCPVAVSELHALDLADVNGDGLADCVIGRRYKSHGFGELGSRDPAYLLWFELVRDPEGPRFVPHVVHDDSGVGTQVMAGDVDGDGLTDVVVGNKMGAFVHLQRKDGARPALPGPPTEDEHVFPEGGVAPVGEDGQSLNLDFETGDLRHWTAEGDAFADQPIHGDTVLPRRRDMTSDHAGAFWIGGYEVHEDVRTGSLTSDPFELTHPFVAFLIAGGAHPETRVDLVDAGDGRRLASAMGRNHEALRPTVLDLTDHVGRRVRIKLIDEHTSHWGHLNFDHLRLYAERPTFPDGLEVSSHVDVRAYAGLVPEEAVEAMTVPDGFHVDLVASEPDLFQPIALTIDERGRLWVAEAHSYPEKRDDSAESKDQILIFEDVDGDGAFETRKVFTTGLDLVSGLEVGYGGVFVGQAPELLFIPDADKDDVPDGPPEVLLDGWGYQDTHETLNAFIWGPDGWLYGCHGVFTHSRVGAPGTPDEERVPLNAGLWRYHPTRREFEIFAWGSSNPWGVDFDDRGQFFITACVIPHLYHVIQGARYVRQSGNHFNPHVYADIPTIADHLHYIGDTPYSGTGRSDDAGGGHAHCGGMIYLGDKWPERYHDSLFVFNIHGNRLNNEVLVPSRSGYVGLHGEDFLLANDKWFRGINLRTGPDGQVYFIDWYDKQACHYVSDEIWNRTNGRLYRVRYGDHQPVKVDLGALDEAGLIELLSHDNDWYVRTARRLLAERGLSHAGTATLLSTLEDTAAPTPLRLRALWALHVGGTLDARTLAGLLEDEVADLRAWAIQLSCEAGAPTRPVLARMEMLAAIDPSPVVRLYLASALQRLPLMRRWGIARGLLARAEDADDPNLPYLTWYGVEPLVPENPAAALDLARSARSPRVAGWIRRRAASEESARDVVVAALARTVDDAEREALLDETLRALGDLRGIDMPVAWPRAYAALEGHPRLGDRALVLAAIFGDPAAYPRLREQLQDADVAMTDRVLALDALVRGKDPKAVRPITRLLDEDALRGRALKALGAFDHRLVAGEILSRWESYDEAQRRDAVSTLTSRPGGALALLDAMEADVVPRSVLTAFELRKIAALGDARVDARMTEVWGVVRPVAADGAAEIARWTAILTAERLGAADRAHGRDVYARTCARCHTLFGEGEAVGPEITGANRGDLAYLLQNMVDPNAIIPTEYQVTIVATTDGRVLTGILEEDREDALVLLTENERVVLGRDEIDATRADHNSMMPVGQLDTLSEEEVVALVAYLQGDTQVPRRATPDNLDTFLDMTSLAGWRGDAELWSVEDGVIVGRTEGLDHNAFLVNDLELGDFRLLLDVRLTPDTENSGIQLRSHPTGDGAVKGYQADVGTGWWGNLYDEHGRGLLVNAQEVVQVQPGEWNRYEIVAVGDRVLIAINGSLCVDYTEEDEDRRRGQVALQIHSGGALEVRFKVLALELDPAPELQTVAGDR